MGVPGPLANTKLENVYIIMSIKAGWGGGGGWRCEGGDKLFGNLAILIFGVQQLLNCPEFMCFMFPKGLFR